MNILVADLLRVAQKLVLWACVVLGLACGNAIAQQDTFSLGLRLTQSVTDVSNPASSSTAAIVQMAYGDAAQSASDKVLTTLTGGSDPRILATTQAYGDGLYTIAQIESAAKASLLPQQSTLLTKIRTATANARVAGAVWMLAQTVRPLGATRPMKLSWYLMLAPGGRLLTSEPIVTEEDPTVVYMVYYSKAVGRSLPASYAWSDAGLIKWQLRRYDGTPVTGWSTVDVGGAYDAPDSDSELGPFCAATAQTLGSCIQGYPSARSLMDANASRKSVIDYVRAVDVSYSPTANGESTPDIKISFDTRVYTRSTCSGGTYRCAGEIGYTVVEKIDRYTMSDSDSLPTKLNSIAGLNSSRPLKSFDVTVSVSDKPAELDPFVIDPFEVTPVLVSTTDMPGIVNLASMSVVIPPATGDYVCPPGMSPQGTQCISTTVSQANVNYTCSSGDLNGSQCESNSSDPASASTSYNCSSGDLIGTDCVTITPAEANTSYNCSSGDLIGTDCVVTSSTPATFDLPADWGSYTPAQKISWLNSHGVTPEMLRAAGTSQTDIDWIYANGYTVGSICKSGVLTGGSCVTTTAVTVTTTYSCSSGEPAINGNCITTTSATQTITYSCSSGLKSGANCITTTAIPSFSLPSGWGSYSPSQKINWFNNNGISPEMLSAVGVPQSDIDWMRGNGYGVGSSCPSGTVSGSNCVTTTSATPSYTYTCASGEKSGTICIISNPANASYSYTCPNGGVRSGMNCNTTSAPSSFVLPADWGSYTSTQKINWFNAINITAEMLRAAGVPQSDIDWMFGNGYTVVSGCTSGSDTNCSTAYKCTEGKLSGSNCITTTSSSASGTTSYTCTTGERSGTNCVSTTSASPRVSYTCTTGLLSGASCVTTYNTPANIGYSCTTGELSGSSCVTTSTSPATWVPLTCPD